MLKRVYAGGGVWRGGRDSSKKFHPHLSYAKEQDNQSTFQKRVGRTLHIKTNTKEKIQLIVDPIILCYVYLSNIHYYWYWKGP